jgi:hypothetical protein
MLTAARFAHAPCPSQARSAAANPGAAPTPRHRDGTHDPDTLLASTGRRACGSENQGGTGTFGGALSVTAAGGQ